MEFIIWFVGVIVSTYTLAKLGSYVKDDDLKEYALIISLFWPFIIFFAIVIGVSYGILLLCVGIGNISKYIGNLIAK